MFRKAKEHTDSWMSTCWSRPAFNHATVAGKYMIRCPAAAFNLFMQSDSCNMGKSDFPDVYNAQSMRAAGPRAEGVY